MYLLHLFADNGDDIVERLLDRVRPRVEPVHWLHRLLEHRIDAGGSFFQLLDDGIDPRFCFCHRLLDDVAGAVQLRRTFLEQGIAGRGFIGQRTLHAFDKINLRLQRQHQVRAGFANQLLHAVHHALCLGTCIADSRLQILHIGLQHAAQRLDLSQRIALQRFGLRSHSLRDLRGIRTGGIQLRQLLRERGQLASIVLEHIDGLPGLAGKSVAARRQTVKERELGIKVRHQLRQRGYCAGQGLGDPGGLIHDLLHGGYLVEQPVRNRCGIGPELAQIIRRRCECFVETGDDRIGIDHRENRSNLIGDTLHVVLERTRTGSYFVGKGLPLFGHRVGGCFQRRRNARRTLRQDHERAFNHFHGFIPVPALQVIERSGGARRCIGQ